MRLNVAFVKKTKKQLDRFDDRIGLVIGGAGLGVCMACVAQFMRSDLTPMQQISSFGSTLFASALVFMIVMFLMGLFRSVFVEEIPEST